MLKCERAIRVEYESTFYYILQFPHHLYSKRLSISPDDTEGITGNLSSVAFNELIPIFISILILLTLICVAKILFLHYLNQPLSSFHCKFRVINIFIQNMNRDILS